jgi:hypothetical protein
MYERSFSMTHLNEKYDEEWVRCQKNQRELYNRYQKVQAVDLRKFFFSGMKKEWIRSEEEKNKKRLQLQTSRRRKHRLQQAIEVGFFF